VSPFFRALRIAASVAALMVGRPSVLPWARARSTPGRTRSVEANCYFFSSMAVPWLWIARWILSAICASGHGSVTSRRA
jgi:hypothetical protein